MNPEPKLKKFAFYNLVILLITVQLVIILNYWYFVFKNIGQATINDTISYQGKLVDSTGIALPDAPPTRPVTGSNPNVADSSTQWNMEFAIYDTADGSNLLWLESWDGTTQNGHPGSKVTVKNGIFSVDLNSLCSGWTPNSTCASGGGVDFSSNSLYLEVRLDSDNNGYMDQTFMPRKRFSSVGYAMNSAKLDGKIIGTTGSAIPLLDGNNTWSGNSTWSGNITSSGNNTWSGTNGFAAASFTGAVTVGAPSVDGIVISPSANSILQNLILQSQTFDNASWTAAGGSISANSDTAPDSSLTADKFVEDSANTSKSLTQPFTYASSTTYTMSIYAKAAGRNYIGLQFEGSSYGTGVYTLTGSGAASLAFGSATPSITSLGNGWYRCVLTSTVVSGAVGNYAIFISNDGVSQTYQGDGTSGVIFWGAQIETAGFAGTYAPTTASQVVPGATPASIASSGAGADVNLLIQPKGAGALTIASNSAVIIQNNLGSGNDLQGANWQLRNDGGITGRYERLIHQPGQGNEALYVVENDTAAINPLIHLSNNGTGLDIDAGTWTISHAGLLTGSSSLNVLKAGDMMTGNLTVGDAATENALTVGKAATGSNVSLTATGIDANVNIDVTPKGTGAVNVGNSANDHLNISGGSVSGPAHTNEILWSQALDISHWTQGGNVTTNLNYGVAPDSTNTSNQMVETTDPGYHIAQQGPVALTANTWTFSIYAKKGTGHSWLQMYFNSYYPSAVAFFDLDLGVVGSVANGTSSITSVGNGWYRCTLSETSIGSGNAYLLAGISDIDGSGVIRSYTGDGTSNIELWGAQLETGPVANSYIPTTSAPVTVSATTANPSISALGTSADIDLSISSKGAGALLINSPLVKLGTGTGTLNYITITNGTTGVAPVFAADGSDTNIGLQINTKGTGALTINAGNVLIPAHSATTIPLTVKGFASQSANLQEWQDSTGAIVLAVPADGSSVANCGGKLITTSGVLGCGSDATGGGFYGGTLTSKIVENVYSETIVTTVTTSYIRDVAGAASANAFVFIVDMDAAAPTNATTDIGLINVPETAGYTFTVDYQVIKQATAGAYTHTFNIRINGEYVLAINDQVTGAAADRVGIKHGYRFKFKPFATSDKWLSELLY